MEDTAQAELKQIKDKNYDEELTAQGIARKRIRHYNFTFKGEGAYRG